MEMRDGTVIAMHGPLVRVQVGEETLVVASRRRLNWEGGTPPAARLVVGDSVTLEMQGEDGVIVAVHARRNCLLRKAPSKNRAQILAANVDQALLIFAAREPNPKPGLLDRFLVACRLADQPLASIRECYDARRGSPALGVLNDDRLAAFHYGDNRIGCS